MGIILEGVVMVTLGSRWMWVGGDLDIYYCVVCMIWDYYDLKIIRLKD